MIALMRASERNTGQLELTVFERMVVCKRAERRRRKEKHISEDLASVVHRMMRFSVEDYEGAGNVMSLEKMIWMGRKC